MTGGSGARSRLVHCALAIAAAAIAACATAPPALRTDARTAAPAADEPFEVLGRLSARHGREAAAANFRWMHRPERDELLLSTPLGSALAQLDGTAGDVRLTLADGRVATAPDWQALTTRVLGAPIPVRGLAWWIRGSAHPDSAYTVEQDAHGRPLVLRQDGWEIVYGYGDAQAVRPVRLTLAYPDTEVRLAVDGWGATPH